MQYNIILFKKGLYTVEADSEYDAISSLCNAVMEDANNITWYPWFSIDSVNGVPRTLVSAQQAPKRRDRYRW